MPWNFFWKHVSPCIVSWSGRSLVVTSNLFSFCETSYEKKRDNDHERWVAQAVAIYYVPFSWREEDIVPRSIVDGKFASELFVINDVGYRCRKPIAISAEEDAPITRDNITRISFLLINQTIKNVVYNLYEQQMLHFQLNSSKVHCALCSMQK